MKAHFNPVIGGCMGTMRRCLGDCWLMAQRGRLTCRAHSDDEFDARRFRRKTEFVLNWMTMTRKKKSTARGLIRLVVGMRVQVLRKGQWVHGEITGVHGVVASARVILDGKTVPEYFLAGELLPEATIDKAQRRRDCENAGR